MNASHTRNGASIKKLILEAAQSAHIMDNMSGGSTSSGGNNSSVSGSGSGAAAATEMNLILFDEVKYANIVDLIVRVSVHVFIFIR